VLKVALKYRRGFWRRIEIKGNQMLGDLDYIIRDAFKHNTLDHLSEFFPKGTWREGFGEIYSGGGGSGARVKIDEPSVTAPKATAFAKPKIPPSRARNTAHIMLQRYGVKRRLRRYRLKVLTERYLFEQNLSFRGDFY
jgi:hypothetical protein